MIKLRHKKTFRPVPITPYPQRGPHFPQFLAIALGKAGLVRTGAMSKWISEMVIRFRDYGKRLSIYNHSRKKQQSRSPANRYCAMCNLNAH